VMRMNTDELRAVFLVQDLFKKGKANFMYSHYDRMVIGGMMPTTKALGLGKHDELRSKFFLERREAGFINIGGPGKIVADGKTFKVDKLGCVYLGRGTKKVTVSSVNAKKPASFFVFSGPAHMAHPNTSFTKEEATPVTLGSPATSNERTIYKYIHPAGIASCQIVMGLTVLADGSIWNTMPPHTHDRRSEAYLYFDVPKGQGEFARGVACRRSLQVACNARGRSRREFDYRKCFSPREVFSFRQNRTPHRAQPALSLESFGIAALFRNRRFAFRIKCKFGI